MIDVLGVVLAGGLSRRMKGPNKSLLDLGGKPLIQNVTERLNSQVKSTIINANTEPDQFAFMKLPIVPDTIGGFAGPLAGVLAGMRWAEKNTSAAKILTAASDTPFFPENYAANMIDASAKQGAQIALATSIDRKHPVFGLWDINLADDLEEFLTKEEGRKVMIFVERFRHCLVPFAGENPDPFFNVNTPDDMQMAEQFILESAKS